MSTLRKPYSNVARRRLAFTLLWVLLSGILPGLIYAYGLPLDGTSGTQFWSMNRAIVRGFGDYGIESDIGSLTSEPFGLSSLTISPDVVYGGYSSTGTATLSAPAPAGGSVIMLSSTTSLATIPASVTVPSGQSSISFSIVTKAVASSTSATITASQGRSTFSASLSIQPLPIISSVSTWPTTVLGASPSLGTVLLSSVAPPGGSVVSLGATGPAGVPHSVSVSAGSTTATFPITTPAVGSNETATISATLSGVTKTAVLTVNFGGFKSLTLSASTVLGGTSVTGTVTLGSPAPASGITVRLVSSHYQLILPPSVTVTANKTSATFTVVTRAVDQVTEVDVNASLGDVWKNAELTLNPAILSGVSISPSTVFGGSPSGGTVKLRDPAPPGGTSVHVSSNNPDVVLNENVPILAGETTGVFGFSTLAVAKVESVTVTARLGNVTKTAQVSLTPLGLSSISVDLGSVVGGSSATGSLVLLSVAGEGGFVVTLSSDNAAVVLPSTVTIPFARAGTSFSFSTNPVLHSTNATITATLFGLSKTTRLTVNPPVLVSLALAPSAVFGGSSSQGTVTLSSKAPSGGMPVNLSSSGSGAHVPATIVVPAGTNSATFYVTTSNVTSVTTPTISATQGGITVSQPLTIDPASSFRFTVAPASVVGGATLIGSLTLGSPAPASGMTITLGSNRNDVKVPGSVTFTAGQTSANFTVTTSLVGSSESATITATSGNITRSASITLNPAILSGFSLSASSVAGGNSVTGKVTLSAPAPVGGSTVNLSISDPAGSVPVTITVPAGATSATFTVSTRVVTANVSATITANQGHSTFTAGLFIHNP